MPLVRSQQPSASFSATVDGDLIPPSVDRCPVDADGSNTDTDGDGLGDVCDPTPFGTQEKSGVVASSSDARFATATAIPFAGSARITIESSAPRDVAGSFSVRVIAPDGTVTATSMTPGTVLASGTTTTVDIPAGWQRGGGVYRFELVFTDTNGRTEVPDNDPLLTLNSCSLCIATPTGSGISAKGQSTVSVASDDLIVLSNSLDAVKVEGTAVVRADSGKIRIKGGNIVVGQGILQPTSEIPAPRSDGNLSSRGRQSTATHSGSHTTRENQSQDRLVSQTLFRIAHKRGRPIRMEISRRGQSARRRRRGGSSPIAVAAMLAQRSSAPIS